MFKKQIQKIQVFTGPNHRKTENRNQKSKLIFHIFNGFSTSPHPHKRLAHPRSPIPPLSTLTSRAAHAHPTSPRSTGFCAIWGCISSSSRLAFQPKTRSVGCAPAPLGVRAPLQLRNDNGSLNKGKRGRLETTYALSAHERGQLGPVGYLAGPGDVWKSRLKAEGPRGQPPLDPGLLQGRAT